MRSRRISSLHSYVSHRQRSTRLSQVPPLPQQQQQQQQPPPPHQTPPNAGRVSGGQSESLHSSSGSAIPSPEDLVAEGKALCQEYINHRLRRSGILTQRQLDILGPPGEYSEVGEELRLVGEELEAMYPDLFKNVHRQLNLAMHSEEVARRTFAMFAEQLCRDGVHWGKVIALFAMAGAFSADCASQGHLDYAQKIVDAFGAFVSTRLCAWLTQQGGWVIVECSLNLFYTQIQVINF